MDNKRVISALLAAVMMGTASVPVAADSISAEGASGRQAEFSTVGIRYNSKFGYKINYGGEGVTIVDFSEKAISGGVLKIPSKIEGIKVVALSDYMSDSFVRQFSGIKTVDIPSTVKQIDDDVLPFYWYTDIESEPLDFSRIRFICKRGSAAEKYAAERNLKYTLRNAGANDVRAPKISKNVAVGAKSAGIKWEKIDNATGYRVYRYDPDSREVIKLADVRTPAYTYRNCKKGELNYFMVRAYRKSGGKTYWSEYSTIKGVTCMSGTAPVINSVKCEKDEYGYRYLSFRTAEKTGYLAVEVLDPYTKKWSEYSVHTVDSQMNSSYSLFDYSVKKYGRYYYETFDKGKTYKLRFRKAAYVTDAGYRDEDLDCRNISGHWKYGKKTVTKTVKFK